MVPHISNLNLENYGITNKESLPPSVYQHFLHYLQLYYLSQVMQEYNANSPIDLDDSDDIDI